MNTRRRPVAPAPNIYAINAKICRLVAEHPCLYDRSDEFYMRQSTVNEAWKDISKKMRNSVKSCKERWRNIRTSYARSIKLHHGANTYYLNNELLFLQNHITPGVPVPLKGRRSKARGQEQSGQDGDSQDVPIEPLIEMKRSPSSVDTEHAPSHDSEEKTESEKDSEDERDSFVTRKKKRLRLSDESREDEKTSKPNVIAPAPAIDFDDAFLQGLRPEIKHMNFHQKLYFKRRVYELLGEIFESGDSLSPTQHHQSCLRRQLPPEKANGAPSPSNPLQHLGLTLQLPKLIPKPTKDAGAG
ncbi:hypothetical protein KR067_012623 [Drosophila pandora]|nr:hypothetical protein KR067_012623 [Drosophila pandora]